MNLPEGFQFSQGSLQDYMDCRRRFQLRYIMNLAWPAIQSEPVLENEHYQRQGELFHRMVQQYLLGVPAEKLEALLHDDDLRGWWENFLRFSNGLTGFQESGSLYPEVSLAASLGGYRLVAKYDLIRVMEDGRVTIFDWKTSRKRPKRAWLKERLQTRVYPYLFARSGAQFNQGKPFQPEQVEMVYWFAGFPDQPEHFQYNAARFIEDETYLENLAAEIDRLGEEDFLLTAQVERCAFCVYRSLCDRGVEAGTIDEAEDLMAGEEVQVGLDFEQIAEIEF